MSSEDPTNDTLPFYQTLGVRSCAVDRIWLQACFEFARDRGIEARFVDALHAFAYPNPRGGPPPPPEPRWRGDFEELEAMLCGEALHSPSLRDAMIADLSQEVDSAQAQMFARRIAAVEDQLVAFDDATGRLLRVGLRQRLEGIRAAPRPRALRVRALADFFYSFAGLWLHARTGTTTAPTLADAVAAVSWSEPFVGAEAAVLDGVTRGGPVHANLLRLRPGSVRARVIDCRDAVSRGVPFAEHVTRLGAVAAISGGFFLYSEPDIAPPSKRFDPVGLLVSDGEVASPPTFPRGALLFDEEGRWHIGRVGPECLVSQGVIHESMAGAITRASVARGPDAPSVAIAAGTVVAKGRSLPVPLNGFVLRSAAAWVVGQPVSFSRPTLDGHVVHDGVAGGPLLLSAGAVAIDLRAEGFWGSAPPVTFSQDETGDRNTLPRLAAGIDGAGRLVLLAVDGRNFERALGMTLREVATVLQVLGCHVATNLDGGSSKRMVLGGRTLDLASTEVEQGAPGPTPKPTNVRPVHTAVVFMPA